MTKTLISKLSILSLVFTFALSTGVQAQGQAGKMKKMKSQAKQAPEVKKDFSEKEKKAFVKAYKKVNQIQQKFRSNISKDMDKKKMRAKAQEVNKEIESTINKEKDMDTKLYRQFLTALKQDKSLLKDIKNRLQGSSS